MNVSGEGKIIFLRLLKRLFDGLAHTAEKIATNGFVA